MGFLILLVSATEPVQRGRPGGLVFIQFLMAATNLSPQALKAGNYLHLFSQSPVSCPNGQFGFLMVTETKLPTQKSATHIFGPHNHGPLWQNGSMKARNLSRASQNLGLHSAIVEGSRPFPKLASPKRTKMSK